MELAKRKKNRLTAYDYSAPNAYFITVCTENRENYFWEKNVGAAIGRPEEVRLTDNGKIVKQHILEIPKCYPMVAVDHYAIMPNHIHLLLQICSDDNGRPVAAPTISTVINQMKGRITKKIGRTLWQKGFYDHVIRGEKDYQEIWNYIEGNPSKWIEDEICGKMIL